MALNGKARNVRQHVGDMLISTTQASIVRGVSRVYDDGVPCSIHGRADKTIVNARFTPSTIVQNSLEHP